MEALIQEAKVWAREEEKERQGAGEIREKARQHFFLLGWWNDCITGCETAGQEL